MTALAGRTALITGSTQGLGQAIAKRFSEAGCLIINNGLVDGRVVGADLRDPAAIESMIAAAGPIDIVINNAVVRHTAPIEAFAPENWNEALAVNLSAAFHTIRLTLPGMKQRGWGRIINISSIYGQRGAANRAGYVTTKTALIGLTRAVALEVVNTGITCNAVCPGTIDVPMHQGANLAGKQPTGRLISLEDVAATLLFLCGPSSSDINGSIFPIDAGWSAS
jgi:3-hydroxybutyrate dehydrogenase